MTEQISTPDVTTATNTSSVDVPETTQDVATDTTSQELETGNDTAEINQDETTEKETTQKEPPKLYANKYKSVEELEKGYDEAQKYIKKYADLEKKFNQLKDSQTPKIIDENGRIDKDFEAKYRFDIDNKEFMAYEYNSRHLDLETRQEVEKLLEEANNLYFYDKNAYESKMNEVEQYFNPNLIKSITRDKDKALAEMSNKFSQAVMNQKMERGANVVNEAKKIPELYNLINMESPDYMPDLFEVFKTTFDTYGTVNIQAFNNSLNKIKELGKKEYIASQEREKAKEQANVPTGLNKTENKKQELTTEQLESSDFWNNFYS